MISRALQPFGTTIFTTMTRMAQERGAVNLAQGFPDFDGPGFIKEAAAKAVMDGPNQYAPMPGLLGLREAIAARFERMTGVRADAEAGVTVTAGCTEGIAAALMGLCNPGEVVVLFEPFYDSYRACVAMAGCTARYVALRPDERTGRFMVDEGELLRAFEPGVEGKRPRAVLLNTPHNPTGKVFTRGEMEVIAGLCVEHGAVVLADEVYERLVFEPEARPQVHMASLPGMAERTVTLSSLGKTFSLTGWKVGWAVASARLTAGVRAAHQFLTFSVATPLQHGARVALEREEECVPGLVAELMENRRVLAEELCAVGFRVYATEGTYFILADHTPVSAGLRVEGDVALCGHLIEKVGVAAIPPSVFYDRPELGRGLVRFAFCKKTGTIAGAVERLRRLRRG